MLKKKFITMSLKLGYCQAGLIMTLIVLAKGQGLNLYRPSGNEQKPMNQTGSDTEKTKEPNKK